MAYWITIPNGGPFDTFDDALKHLSDLPSNKVDIVNDVTLHMITIYHEQIGVKHLDDYIANTIDGDIDTIRQYMS